MAQYGIIDLGRSYSIRLDEGGTLRIFQYSVWRVDGNDLVQAVEASDDIEYLRQKYGTEAPIIQLPSGTTKKTESALIFQA
jgi:hypothetical protein